MPAPDWWREFGRPLALDAASAAGGLLRLRKASAFRRTISKLAAPGAALVSTPAPATQSKMREIFGSIRTN